MPMRTNFVADVAGRKLTAVWPERANERRAIYAAAKDKRHDKEKKKANWRTSVAVATTTTDLKKADAIMRQKVYQFFLHLDETPNVGKRKGNTITAVLTISCQWGATRGAPSSKAATYYY